MNIFESNFKKTIILIIALVVIIFGYSLVSSAYELFFAEPKENAEVVSIEIPDGSSAKQVIDILVEKKLVSHPEVMKFYIKLRGLGSSFKKGTFLVTPGTSIRNIVNLLTKFNAQDEISITFIEGLTTREVAQIVHDNGFSYEAWLDLTGYEPGPGIEQKASSDFSDKFNFLKVKPADASLEGFLFPDTYRIFKDGSPKDILIKMLNNFERRVGSVSYNDLILASIVEREIHGERDRKIVADIFKRRLKIGMPLQADSTVNYVTGKETPALSSIDRGFDTPWNTYLYRGLPPTPISNPSLESIEAVRNPIANSYLYFLTDKDGVIHYGKTLEEHNINKAKYLH